MTDDCLAAILAERILGWTVGPERFMIGGRRWLARWRFQPATRLEDAFRLLERTREYATGTTENGRFWAKVRVDRATGEACESSQPRAMTYAIARAIGLKVDTLE